MRVMSEGDKSIGDSSYVPCLVNIGGKRGFFTSEGVKKKDIPRMFN